MSRLEAEPGDRLARARLVARAAEKTAGAGGLGAGEEALTGRQPVAVAGTHARPAAARTPAARRAAGDGPAGSDVSADVAGLARRAAGVVATDAVDAPAARALSRRLAGGTVRSRGDTDARLAIRPRGGRAVRVGRARDQARRAARIAFEIAARHRGGSGAGPRAVAPRPPGERRAGPARVAAGDISGWVRARRR